MASAATGAQCELAVVPPTTVAAAAAAAAAEVAGDLIATVTATATSVGDGHQVEVGHHRRHSRSTYDNAVPMAYAFVALYSALFLFGLLVNLLLIAGRQLRAMVTAAATGPTGATAAGPTTAATAPTAHTAHAACPLAVSLSIASVLALSTSSPLQAYKMLMVNTITS